jgi:hypothetical protein
VFSGNRVSGRDCFQLGANEKKSKYGDKAVLMSLPVGDKILAETKTCPKRNESSFVLGMLCQRRASMLFCIQRRTD